LLKKSNSPVRFVFQEITWAPNKLTVAEASLFRRMSWDIPFLSLTSSTEDWRGFLSALCGYGGGLLPAPEVGAEAFISNLETLFMCDPRRNEMKKSEESWFCDDTYSIFWEPKTQNLN